MPKRSSARPKGEVKLPAKLSDCIELALHDLGEVERLRRTYVVEMNNNWHGQDALGDNAKCTVCFAGSVMARTLKANPNKEYIPESFSNYNQVRLLALDDARNGDVSTALQRLKTPLPSGVSYNPDVEPYENYPKQFKRDMRQVVQTLRTLGF